MDTLKQLGELLLAAIPTIVCLLIVWGAYRNLVQKKLQRVLGERHARTEGAIEEAQAQIAKAEARTAEYEQRLREARSQIYKTQEGRRKHIMEKRSTALAEAHRVADEMVKRAHTDLERDVREAQGTLQQQAETLAAQIIDSILKPFAVSRG
ncbi:MAG TPA: ATP synthase F0 subunit B [Candidatus Angelobacter sp.]|nr:ATP synthase F0 subunit B [Candidatus Angelobacter sp.]